MYLALGSFGLLAFTASFVSLRRMFRAAKAWLARRGPINIENMAARAGKTSAKVERAAKVAALALKNSRAADAAARAAEAFKRARDEGGSSWR